MNLIKLLSTDFFTGQILFSGKGGVRYSMVSPSQPRKKSLRFAVLILQLIPRYNKGIGEATDKPLSLETPGLGHGQR